MTTNGVVWVTPPETLEVQFKAWNYRLTLAVFTLMQWYAPQIESWMKANAVWTDRTGNARQTLYAVADNEGRIVYIKIGYGVDYGRWLEYANAGNYAILKPALDYWVPRMTGSIQRMLDTGGLF